MRASFEGVLSPLPEFRRLLKTFSELFKRFGSCLVTISRECLSQNPSKTPRKLSRADSLSEIAIFLYNPFITKSVNFAQSLVGHPRALL